ncbi:ABC transporter permease [bacterium]|nr:ABC transporter permease [bacterium]
MWTYIVKRLLLMIPTLLGVTVIVYGMISIAPGDPLALSAGEAERGLTKEAMRGAQMGETYSKDPVEIAKRYWKWLTLLFSWEWKEHEPPPEDAWSLLNDHVRIYEAVEVHVGKLHLNLFNFQRSLKDRRPVLQTLIKAISISIVLNIISLVITYSVAIPLGIFSAVKRDTLQERVITVLLFILYSLPSFWVAYMLILYVGQGSGKLELLPIAGLHGEEADAFLSAGNYWAYAKDFAQHLVLPIICMTLGSFAYLSRQTRAGMLEVLRQDYITTARAKGLPESLVIGKHALRNSLIPIVTLMASLLPALIGGSIIIEYIFNIPGMGRLGFTSVLARDYTTLMAINVMASILVLLGILMSDILYTIVDPRVTFEKQVG